MKQAFLSSDKEEMAIVAWAEFKHSKAFTGLKAELRLPADCPVPATFVAGWHLGFVCALNAIEQKAIQAVGPPTNPAEN